MCCSFANNVITTTKYVPLAEQHCYLVQIFQGNEAITFSLQYMHDYNEN